MLVNNQQKLWFSVRKYTRILTSILYRYQYFTQISFRYHTDIGIEIIWQRHNTAALVQSNIAQALLKLQRVLFGGR